MHSCLTPTLKQTLPELDVFYVLAASEIAATDCVRLGGQAPVLLQLPERVWGSLAGLPADVVTRLIGAIISTGTSSTMLHPPAYGGGTGYLS